MGIDAVSRSLAAVLDDVRPDTSGTVADYIPELAKADVDGLGIAVTSVLGHSYGAGDDARAFTIQSVSKPFVYALALAELGSERLHAHVGWEPSGEPFNAISLDDRGRPANPMINAGAIVTTSLVAGDEPGERFARIARQLSAFAGRDLTVDDAVHASEAATGDRNRALAYLTKASGVLVGDPLDATDAYFRTCALLVTAHDLAVMGATLANGGTNPVTGARVVDASVARDTLSMMATCGMYDAAGGWLLRVGMPAKSGVGGGIVAVKPGQFGIGVFSPRLDETGNSTRGVAALERLSREFGLHLLQHPSAPTSPVERVERMSDGIVVRLRGDLDFVDAEQVAYDIARTVAAHAPARVVVDCSSMTAVTPVAARVLHAVAVDARAANTDVQFVDPGSVLS